MRLLGPESRDRARGHPVQRADSRLKRTQATPAPQGHVTARTHPQQAWPQLQPLSSASQKRKKPNISIRHFMPLSVQLRRAFRNFRAPLAPTASYLLVTTPRCPPPQTHPKTHGKLPRCPPLLRTDPALLAGSLTTMHRYLIMPSLRFLCAPCRSFASLLADRYLKFPLVISSQYHKQCVSSPVALRIRDSMCLHLSCVCKNVRRSRGPAHSHVPHGSPRHILLLHVHSPPAPPRHTPTHRSGSSQHQINILTAWEGGWSPSHAARTLSPPPANQPHSRADSESLRITNNTLYNSWVDCRRINSKLLP